MTEVLVAIRNLVLAGIMAWLGMDFTPSKPSEPDKNQPGSPASSLIRG